MRDLDDLGTQYDLRVLGNLDDLGNLCELGELNYLGDLGINTLRSPWSPR